uniref:Uncharacterized protein n=1 Tax=Anguilla anguilla TaxID=7936 RepID=A0A0E9P6J3_ANGAN
MLTLNCLDCENGKENKENWPFARKVSLSQQCSWPKAYGSLMK